MPLGLVKKFQDLLKNRKPMGAKRKKLKKGKAHYSDVPGVHKDSAAGQLRERNKRVKAQLDELE